MARQTQYYAVQRGRAPGVYTAWDEASFQVNGFAGAVHKKFKTDQEAWAFVRAGSNKDGPATMVSQNQASKIVPRESQTSRRPDIPYDVEERPSKALEPLKPVKPFKLSKKEQKIVDAGNLLVYCDENGGRMAKAGSGIHWIAPAGLPDISERLPGKQTNQCAELYAMLRVFETDPDPSRPLYILSDSKYSIGCMSKWLQGWKKRNWKTVAGENVANVELIKLLHWYQIKRTGQVTYVWVPAHVGIRGNERADYLAAQGAKLPLVKEKDWDLMLKMLESQTDTRIDADTDSREVVQGAEAGDSDTSSGLESAAEDDDHIDESWLLDSDEEATLAENQNF